MEREVGMGMGSREIWVRKETRGKEAWVEKERKNRIYAGHAR